MEITKVISINCEYCKEELHTSYISLSCNDTGITADEYNLDFCNIECLKTELHDCEEAFSESELEEMSNYYMMRKHLSSHNKEDDE